MDSFQEKAGGEWQRRPPSHGKKYKGEGKAGEEAREEGGGKKRNRQFRRNNDDKARDNQKNSSNQEGDNPVTFNAHSLDLDPGIVIPERPSIDLTYTDFTRESYEMGAGRPFVPKKKKSVPFELSETPKMQADYWEGRAPGRRKLLNAMENGAEAKANGEGQQTQEKKQPEYKKDNQEKNGDKKDKQQQKQQKDRPWSGSQNQEAKDRDRKRQEPKQQKGGQQDRQEGRQEGRQENKRQENKQNGGGRGPDSQSKKGAAAKEGPKNAAKGVALEAPKNAPKGGSKEALSEPGKRASQDAPKEAHTEHPKRASEEAKAAPKEKKGGFFSRNKNRQNNNAVKQETRNKGEDQPQEPASQSLIRPYWLKK